MKSALLLAPEKIEVREIDPPKLSEDEVMIQPIRIGICGSDVSFYLGHRTPPHSPFTLGHECVGRVVAVAPGVTKLAVGQRVIVEPNYSCGTCRFCRIGRGNICPNKKSMGVSVPGCFAEYATAPVEFTWPVPDAILDADAATIEPLTVSLHALLQSGTQLGDTVAVVGCGVVGLLLIHVAVAQGVRVLAHDRFAEKLGMARQLGAQACADEDVAKLWLNENVSTVFECAGATATVELALSAAPRGSQVMLLGLSSSPASFVPLRVVREGIRIEPSLIYDHPADFASSIRLVANKTLQPSKIVTETIPFDSIGRALQVASTGKSGKIHTVLS
jgi:L-iditol 2-dehydrogenase